MNTDDLTASDGPAARIDIEDPAALLPYLHAHDLVASSDTPRIKRLAGGVSNRIVLVEPRDKPAFVLKQPLDKLRVASDWFASPSRIHCEARALRALRELMPEGTITSLMAEDFREHIIALSAVPTPHRTLKEILLAGEPQLSQFEIFGQILGQLHSRSYKNPLLAQAFDDRSHFDSLRIEPYYRFSAGRLLAAETFLSELIEETLSCRICLVHGDFSPKNILVHADKFVLIDHEAIHYGDPAFDVGFALTHLLAKALHRKPVRRLLLQGAQHYARDYLRLVRQVGLDHYFEARACRHTIACLLARVVGRSPLEYLSEAERESQFRIAMDLMTTKPVTLCQVLSQFEGALC